VDVNIISFIYILYLSVHSAYHVRCFCFLRLLKFTLQLHVIDCIDKRYVWNIYQHIVVVAELYIMNN